MHSELIFLKVCEHFRILTWQFKSKTATGFFLGYTKENIFIKVQIELSRIYTLIREKKNKSFFFEIKKERNYTIYHLKNPSTNLEDKLRI